VAPLRTSIDAICTFGVEAAAGRPISCSKDLPRGLVHDDLIQCVRTVKGPVGFLLNENCGLRWISGFLDKPRKPAFKLIVIKSSTLEAEVRLLKLLSARLVFI